MGKISGKQPVTPLYLKSSMVFDISFKSQNLQNFLLYGEDIWQAASDSPLSKELHGF